MNCHNFRESYIVVEVCGEDFVVGVIPGLCRSIPGEHFIDGIVSKSGFLDKIDT